MTEEIDSLVRECTVQLHSAGRFLGSGFVVTPGLVLTCAHVVGSQPSGVTVVWNGRSLSGQVQLMLPEAREPRHGYWPFPDLALVEIDPPAGSGCVWLAEQNPTPGSVLSALGFSERTPAEKIAPDGMRLVVVGDSGGYLRVKDDLVAHGLSGSPVLDEVSGRVCGMVKASADYGQALGGWIIPAQVLRAHLPEVLARNQAAHPPGTHWWNLATKRRDLTVKLFGLANPLAPLPAPTSVPPSWWLDPRNQVVGFQARPELDVLHTWAVNEDPGMAVARLVYGPGGAGKTRLAVELGRRLERDGWIAGLVAEENPAALAQITEGLEEVVTAGHRVLVVVDYAETRDVEVRGLLERVPLLGPGRVRVLLLARFITGWWSALRPRGPMKYLVDHKPLWLGNLAATPPAARQIVINAAADFARALAIGTGGQADPTSQIAVLPEAVLAAAERHQDALRLHALALASVLDVRDHPQDLPREDPGRWADPLTELLGHEQAYWRRAVARLGIASDQRVAAQVLVVPSLYAARTAEDAAEAVRRIPEVARRFAGEASVTAGILQKLYPEWDQRRSRWWAPLPLDRLAESLLLEILSDLDDDPGQACDLLVGIMTGADTEQAEQALTLCGQVLSTAGGQNPQVAEVLVRSIDELIAGDPVTFSIASHLAAAGLPDPDLLTGPVSRFLATADTATLVDLHGRLPQFHLRLSMLAVDLLAQAIRQHPDPAATGDLETLGLRAFILSNLGARLSEVGSYDEALGSTDEAVAIYRRLARADPDTYLPALASALNNLGIGLANIGRHQQALDATDQAVAIYRRLARADPDTYLPALASALNNLGLRLAGAGRHQQALAPAERSVRIYRRLARADPDTYLSALAMALHNLGSRLAKANRHQHALASTDQAVAIYRQLAEIHPDAYLPDLASALSSLGNKLGEVRRHREALAFTEEAVAILRRLAKVNPDAYLPDLASSLNNHGILLGAVGQRKQALACAEEAVDIRRRLAKANPDAHLPDLASALSNLGSRLGKVGRHQQALDSVAEAVFVYRRLARLDPDVYLPNLATALHSLGAQLDRLNRHQQALASAEEVVTIRRRLAKANPDAYLPDLASGLSSLGTELGEVGRHREALAFTEEAVAILRRLAKVNPDAYLPDLAFALDGLGSRLGEIGRHLQALTPAREAVAIYRRLAEVDSGVRLADLADLLNNLSVRLGAMGHHQEAMAYAEEAVDIRRRLAKANPDTHLPRLALALGNLGNRLGAIGRHQQALSPADEAVAICRQLSKADPDAYLPLLAAALHNRGIPAGQLGRHRDALSFVEEAVAIYRRLAGISPDAYLPDLAHALGNLYIEQVEVGDHEQALASAEETVAVYQTLAQADADAYLPELAEAVGTLGEQLARLGRYEQALGPAEEAVRIRRQLAEPDLDTRFLQLAMALAFHGRVLEEVGDARQAVAAQFEAAGIFGRFLRLVMEVGAPEDAMLNRLLTSARALARLFRATARDEAAEQIERALMFYERT